MAKVAFIEEYIYWAYQQ